MQLYLNPASPFARKVLVVAHERGLIERLEPVNVLPLPIRPVPELARVNPLGKVPCLVLDGGETLYDSRVIAEYLDALPGAPALFPPAGAPRWAALRQQALGDGILDAAVAVRYERVVRPAERQFPEWIEGQLIKVRQGLAALEREPAAPGLTIGQVAAACALGYLDFRFPEEGWRTRHPRLASFYEEFSARPSMRATVPPAS